MDEVVLAINYRPEVRRQDWLVLFWASVFAVAVGGCHHCTTQRYCSVMIITRVGHCPACYLHLCYLFSVVS